VSVDLPGAAKQLRCSEIAPIDEPWVQPIQNPPPVSSLVHFIRRSAARLICGLIVAFGFMPATHAQTLPAGTRFVMSHFGGDSGGGDERLYVSYSADGLNWIALNNGLPVWQPVGWSPFVNVVRDPTITFANGFYWVAYTSGNYGKHASFGLVKSADLLNWTFVGEIGTAIPGATDPLTWNPCFFEDGDGSIHIFVSVSPTGGSNYNPTPNMRSYELHPLNASFAQWSMPVAIPLPQTNTNEFWAWKEGDTYHAIYVSFAQSSALIHVTSKSLLTGWGNAQVIGFNQQEGPFVLRKPDGGYRLYLEGGNSAPTPGYRTCDFTGAFTNPTAQTFVTATVPMRNGKPAVARDTMNFATWQTQKLASVPAAMRGPNADPDADGLANLVECTLGSDPLVFSARPESFLRAMGPDTFVGLRFFRLRQFSDATVQVEGSANLNDWNASLVTESITLMSDGTEWLHVRDSVATASGGSHYLRLKSVLSSAAPGVRFPANPSRRQHGHTSVRAQVAIDR
jgi:hypothetical protein